MKLQVFLSIIALSAAATVAGLEEANEHARHRRGVVGLPAAVSYSSQYIHHAPSIPVAYHVPVVKYVAPLPAVKVVQPYPVTKFFTPAVSYTKLAYASPVIPYYGYGYSHFH